MDRQTAMWAREKGLRDVDIDTVAGMIERIPVTLRISGQSTVFLFSVEADTLQLALLNNHMMAYGGALGGVLQVITEGGKMALVRSSPALLNGLGLDTLLMIFFQKAKTLGIQPRTTCEVCGQPAESVMLADARATTVCTSCRAFAQKNVKKGTPLTGFIGSLLGAAVGAIPGILTIVLLDSYMRVLGIVIGVCSFFGYRLLSGNRNRGFVIISVAISTLLAVMASEQVSIVTSAESDILYTLLHSILGISFLREVIKRYIITGRVEVIAPVSSNCVNKP